MSDFPIAWVRAAFPALNTGDRFIFFDNGAGAQVPQLVLDAVRNHLINCNVQRGGRYRKSREVDATIDRASRERRFLPKRAGTARGRLRDECDLIHQDCQSRARRYFDGSERDRGQRYGS